MLELHPVGALHEIDEEHRQDEAHGAEHADRREGLDGILAGLLQGVVGHGIGDGDGRHIECDTKRIEGVERAELDGGACAHSIPAGADHRGAGDALAQGENLLRRDPLVGDDAHQGRHENGDKTLGREEQPDLRAEAAACEETAHRGEVSPPRGELQKVHQDQPEADVGFVHEVRSLVVCIHKNTSFSRDFTIFEG